jgi:hypothetical protein
LKTSGLFVAISPAVVCYGNMLLMNTQVVNV